MSDESDAETEQPQYDIYRRKFQLLLERCEILQQDNEKLVNRIYNVKQLLKKRKLENKFLMNRLDSHGDDWRNTPAADIDIKPNINSVKSFYTNCDKTKVTPEKSKKKPKRKVQKTEKSERDPLAPKRPPNPFFQFCQEQRTIVMEQINSELKPGEAEFSKQELTKRLALKWKSLSPTDKKVYLDKYEKSRLRYAEELDAYYCNVHKNE